MKSDSLPGRGALGWCCVVGGGGLGGVQGTGARAGECGRATASAAAPSPSQGARPGIRARVGDLTRACRC